MVIDEYHTYPPSSENHCAIACSSTPTTRGRASVKKLQRPIAEIPEQPVLVIDVENLYLVQIFRLLLH